MSPATVDKKGTAARLHGGAHHRAVGPEDEDLVNHLRADVIPKATKGTDEKASSGGQTAGYIDLANQISDKLPSMIAIVVGLSFIVLLLAFRSLLCP